MADFIPSADDQFDGFFTTLNTDVQANYMDLSLSLSQQTTLNTAYT